MSRASDILRERARKADDIIAAYGLMHPDELRAIADLLEACAYPLEDDNGNWCLICDNHMPDHAPDCALAAAEREITGATK